MVRKKRTLWFPTTFTARSANKIGHKAAEKWPVVISGRNFLETVFLILVAHIQLNRKTRVGIA